MPDRSGPPRGPDGSGPLGSSPSTLPGEKAVRRGGAFLIAGFVGLVLCAFVLAFLAAAVRRQETYALDTVGNSVMHSLASPPLDALMNAASFVGTDPVLLLATAGIAAVLARFRRHREALFLGVVVVGSMVLNIGMKVFFHRDRPALPWARALADFSFPSGHSMDSLAFGLAVSLIVWRLAGPRWGILSLVVALIAAGTIGLSRIYLGYHYVTDVLGGFATAVLWVGIVVGVFRAVADWPSGAKRQRARARPR